MKLNREAIFFLLILTPIFGEGKILSLPEGEKFLSVIERKGESIFLCQTETKRVFGKNHSLSSECYSLSDQSLSVSLSSFFEVARLTEIQYAFFTAENRQVYPEWEEFGTRYVLIGFVFGMESQMYVQVIKKEQRLYYLWKSNASQWVLEN